MAKRHLFPESQEAATRFNQRVEATVLVRPENRAAQDRASRAWPSGIFFPRAKKPQLVSIREWSFAFRNEGLEQDRTRFTRIGEAQRSNRISAKRNSFSTDTKENK